MSLPIAILCIDFDGTLIDDDIRIHPADVEILKSFPATIQPVMTTGRDLRSVKSIFQDHGVYKGIPFPWPGVFMNGGLTLLPGEKPFQKHVFNQETRQAVIALANSFTKTAFTFFGLDRVDLVNPNSFGLYISKAHHLNAKAVIATELPAEIIKVMVVEPDTTALDQVRNYSKIIKAEMATSLPYAYEINPPGINKAASLMALLKEMHMDHIPIYAAGDAENDLALFQLAQTSFAPTEAHPKALSRADHHIQRAKNGLLAPIIAQILSY